MVDLRQGLLLIGPDLMDILLPFILIFTIVYAVSHQVKLFEINDKFKIVISLAIAFMVIIPHITGNFFYGNVDVVNVINRSVPQVAMIIVGVVLVLMLIGATGKADNLHTRWVRWVALLIVGMIFLDNLALEGGGLISNFALMGWFADGDFQALLLIALIFGLIVWFVTGSDDSKKELRKRAKKTYYEHLESNPDDVDGARSAEKAILND